MTSPHHRLCNNCSADGGSIAGGSDGDSSPLSLSLAMTLLTLEVGRRGEGVRELGVGD